MPPHSTLSWPPASCLCWQRCCKARRNLSVGDQCDAVVAAGCLPELTPVLYVVQASTAEHVAACLWSLAQHSDDHCNAIAAAGCLPPLVALLSSDSTAVVTNAAGALRWLSQDSDARRDAMVAAGCLPPLAALLSQSSAAVVQYAAGTIRHLAEDSRSVYRAVAAAEGVRELAALLPQASAAEHAVVALYRLLYYSAEVKDAVAVPGCLSRLARLLYSPSAIVSQSAAALVAAVAAASSANNNFSILAVVAAGCLPQLLSLLSIPFKITLQYALEALQHVAAGISTPSKVAFADQFWSKLIPLLSHETPWIAYLASEMLAHMARSVCSCSFAASADLRPLAALLRHASDRVAHNAARVLEQLTTDADESLRRAIVDAGCLTPLKVLLGGGSANAVQQASAALLALANGTGARSDIAASGMFQPLAALLSHDSPAIALNAASMLGHLAAGNEQRTVQRHHRNRRRAGSRDSGFTTHAGHFSASQVGPGQPGKQLQNAPAQ